jgi:hypothetical protein
LRYKLSVVLLASMRMDRECKGTVSRRAEMKHQAS